MKQKMKALFIFLFSMTAIFAFAQGMNTEAYADSTYAQYIPTESDEDKDLIAKQVAFNGISWYIIADNSSSAREGSVTLLAVDPIGTSVFNNSTGDGNAYNSSVIKTYLDSQTATGGSFADAADALCNVTLSDVDINGARLYLLSETDAEALPEKVRMCGFIDGFNYWWTRTANSDSRYAQWVAGDDGTVGMSCTVNAPALVRPALQLDLSSVVFSSIYRTFSTIVTGGSCGDQLTWKLDDEAKVLTISGTGTMYHYTGGTAPWKPYHETIETVVIEPGVTSIGDQAFEFCYQATSITIPDTVQTIGAAAFVNCGRITEFTIPGNVTTIGQEAFSGCSQLESIIIPDSVTSMGTDAFSICRKLASVTLSNQLTTISDYAFSGCIVLESIEIPNSVKTIGQYAFSGCTELSSADIPGSVTWIKPYAFANCKKLAMVTIPSSVASIEQATFMNCEALTELIIPDNVYRIGPSAFSGCKGLTSITLPDSLQGQGIDRDAFADCEKLTSIVIPEGMTSIKEGTFRGCTKLTEISIPDTVTNIGEGAFKGCDSLVTDIVIPDGMTEVYKETFAGCASLTSIILPPTIEKIEDGAFSGCSSLNGITIPVQVWYIGESAFESSGLTDLVVPYTVQYIYEKAFRDCKNLKTLTIPSGIEFIGEYATDQCENLETVYYKGSDRSILINAGIPEEIIFVAVSSWAELREALLQSGKVRLIRDVTAGSGVSSALAVPSGTEVILDLNGYTINRNSSSGSNTGNVITVSGSLTIEDKSNTKTGKITGGKASGNAGGISVRGSSGNIAKLVINGGSISGNNTTAYNGGGVNGNYAEIIMNGGSISGNTAVSGGGISLTESTFTLNNGFISGNTATVSSGVGGGGIYAQSNSKIYMNGGIISNNIASYTAGGGVFLNGSSYDVRLLMSGGSIIGNSATQGGGIYNHGYVEISGGSITNNVASENKGGGGIYKTKNNSAVKLSGDCRILGNYQNSPRGDSNIFLPEGAMINAAVLDSNARIGIQVETIPSGTDTAINIGSYYNGMAIDANFKSDDSAVEDGPYYINCSSQNIYLQVNMQGKHLVSFDSDGGSNVNSIEVVSGDVIGASPTDPIKTGYIFEGWYQENSDGSLASSKFDFAHTQVNSNLILKAKWQSGSWQALQEQINAGGNITLNQDVIASAGDGPLNVPSDKNVTIDLNGHKIDRNLSAANDSGYVMLVKGTLIVQDTSLNKTGRITGGYTSDDYAGGGIFVNGVSGTGKLILRGGTITGNRGGANGGGIFGNHAEIYVYGGRITGNTASYGGGISLQNSQFTMSNGTVDRNTADLEGGGIYATTGCELVISGGTVSDNEATGESGTNGFGGGISAYQSTLNISGGNIKNNRANLICSLYERQ